MQWQNFSEDQTTVVSKAVLSRAVPNPGDFFTDIDDRLSNGEKPTVTISMDSPPR